MTSMYAGKDVQDALDEAAAEWDSITRKLGTAKQKASYANFLKIPRRDGCDHRQEEGASGQGLALRS